MLSMGRLLAAVMLLAGDGIVFEKTNVELGGVRAAGSIAAVFEFAVGAEGAEILSARASCGCLRPQVECRRYRPGERGRIVLGIHAATQTAGPKRFLLHLDVRDPSERTITLWATAELLSDLVVEPANLIVYSNGKAPVRQEVRIVDRRGAGLAIAAVAASPPLADARILDREEDAPESVRRIAFTVPAAAPPGGVEARLEVRTEDAQYPVIEIPVTIVRLERYRVLPDRLRLQWADDRVGRARFHVLDPLGEPIVAEGFACDHPAVRCIPPARPDRQLRFAIEVEAGAVAPPLETVLRLHIVRPEPAEIAVPLRIEK